MVTAPPNKTAKTASIIGSLTSITVRMPAQRGSLEDNLPTPCLVLDLDAFEHNVKLMNGVLTHLRKFRKPSYSDAIGGENQIMLRPHAKPHKSSLLARKLLTLHGGLAAGVCCQTVTECEEMVKGGVSDVLFTNLVPDLGKARRLAELSLDAETVGVCVDCHDHLNLLEQATSEVGGRLGIMIELGVASRTGIDPANPSLTVELARRILSSKTLWLRGLQVYNGLAQHLRTETERKEAVKASGDVANIHLAALEEALWCAPRGATTTRPQLVVSGGGTGSLPHEVECGPWTELQCGSYMFYDGDYAANSAMAAKWRQSLFVVGSVVGVYGPRSNGGLVDKEHCVVDVGLKSVAFDSGAPVPLAPAKNSSVETAPVELKYVGLGDEHGAVCVAGTGGPVEGERPRPTWQVGTRMRFIPGHCDPTVNLYHFLVGVRNGVVEEIFPIDARGY